MSNTIKTCEICGTEFVTTSSRAKFCSEACKQKNKRRGKIDAIINEEFKKPVPFNSPEDWLARRCMQLGCDWKWVKTGSPAGSMPDIKVPSLWGLSDIDQSMQFRGQWGERGV